MSLNIVDSLLDKLSLVSKDKNIPFGKKFTGSQSFLGTNHHISQSIPTEFQTAFMDDELFSLAHHNKMNRSSSLDSKMNIFHYFESSNDRLVSRVSKLLSPPLLSSQDTFNRFVPNYLDLLGDPELFLNQGFKLLCEEVEQHFEKLNKRSDSKGSTGKERSDSKSSTGKERSDSKGTTTSKDSSQMLTPSVESPCKQTNRVNFDCKNIQQTNSSSSESTFNQSNKLKSQSTSDKDSPSSFSTSVESSTNTDKVLNSQTKSDISSCSPSSLPASVESPSDPNKVLNSHLSDKDSCHQVNLSSSDRNASKEIMMQDVTVSPLVTVVVQDDKKILTNNCHVMNEKLASRKNKELQKRSKKRRRRQKKHNNAGLDKVCATKVESGILKNTTTAQAISASPPSDSGSRNIANPSPGSGSKNSVSPSPGSASKSSVCLSPGSGSKNSVSLTPGSASKSSDILCDIVTLADNSVQILLPDSSSFVISIESEDSDWDSNSDCEWLNDCSEFEFSGIFISNLSAPLTSTSSDGMCFSHLSGVLRRVNDNWNKAMMGLKNKRRVATKVSFAPDDELVKVVHVDAFDRKGEWETYACERMRFKKRINELEKVISPCLSKQHREKVFSRFRTYDD